MPPTRILLIGAGAIGAFYGSRLATVSHVAVSALCRSNFQAVAKSGFRVTSPLDGTSTFHPEFTFRSGSEARRTTREKRIRWDYLLVATKALPDLSDDSELLEGLVDDATAVVLVQNGLGIEDPYCRRFPAATVLSAVTIASCAQPEHGVVRHHRWTRISVGPFLPSTDVAADEQRKTVATERNARFVELLRQGGIPDAEALGHASLQFVRWHKVAINAAMNPTCVLAGGSTNHAMAVDEALYEHMIGVMQEVLAVAPKVLGKPLPKKLPTPQQVLKSTIRDDSGSRPSMWLDWEGGKRMELEVILGNPIRMARERGLQMPRVQTMYATLKMAQEMREKQRETSRL